MHEYLGRNNDGDVCSATEAWDVTFLRERYSFPDAVPGGCQRFSRPTFTVIPQISFSPSRLPLIHAAYSFSFMNYRIILICHDNLYFHVS